MTTSQTPDKPNITVSLVTDLIKEQFPQWAHLPIMPVKQSGWDNKTFRLGEQMVIRLPSAQRYAAQVHKEQKWLPLLAPHLTVAIPTPLAMGQPSKEYPWHWSVYSWIEGETAQAATLDAAQMKQLAVDLAQFLNQLHTINTTGAPEPGPHNFYRGASPAVYDDEMQEAIAQLHDIIDVNKVKAVWQKALSSTWHKKPVWVHGDLSAENILLKDGRLVAVIDFGCMAVGDPACDLVIAWTFFNNESRNVFKSLVNLDQDTWDRARGWALWKALITVAALEDKNSAKAQKNFYVIKEIL